MTHHDSWHICNDLFFYDEEQHGEQQQADYRRLRSTIDETSDLNIDSAIVVHTPDGKQQHAVFSSLLRNLTVDQESRFVVG